MAIDTTYELKPGESIAQYNARISAYNASKSSTSAPKGSSSSGDAQVLANQQAAAKLGIKIPGVGGGSTQPPQVGTGATPPTPPTVESYTAKQPQLPTAPTYQAPSGVPKLNLPSLPTLPEQGDLIQFSNALASAQQLAKENRNAMGLSVVASNFAPGMLNASSFGEILGGLNRAGNDTLSTSLELYNNAKKNEIQTAQQNYENARQRALDQYGAESDAYNAAVDIATKKYNSDVDKYNIAVGKLTPEVSVYTDESGNLTGIDTKTGDKLWVQAGTGKGTSSSTSKPFTSGGLTLEPEDVTDFYTTLQTGKTAEGTTYGNARGTDGFVDPRVWLQLYDTWIAQNGLAEDFFDKFPLSNINNKNTWIRAELDTRGLADEWDKYIGGGSSDGSAGWNSTQRQKLEAAGLLNAPRDQQLAFLYPSQQGSSGVDALIDGYLNKK